MSMSSISWLSMGVSKSSVENVRGALLQLVVVVYHSGIDGWVRLYVLPQGHIYNGKKIASMSGLT